MNVCICLRGELLRPSCSTHALGSKVIECDSSEENINRQNDIMESIINHIIIPYKNEGYNVFISGSIYKCPEYDEKLEEFFPNNTIKQIDPGKKGAVEMFKESIIHASEQHPNCKEYISLRGDYIMLRDIIIKNMKEEKDYIGMAWSNAGFVGCSCDIFYVISKNVIPQFIEILWRRGHSDSHYVTDAIRKRKIPAYFIWGETYRRAPSSMTYTDYLNNLDKHKNRPMANYMRDDSFLPKKKCNTPGFRARISKNSEEPLYQQE